MKNAKKGNFVILAIMVSILTISILSNRSNVKLGVYYVKAQISQNSK